MTGPKHPRYDVVIVGAGALGLATAYHLSEQWPTASVLVVDARAGPGEGSTGASNAMVRDVFSSRDNHLLAQHSIRFYRRLMEEHDDLRSPSPLLDLYGYLWLLPEALLREFRSLVDDSSGSIDARTVDRDTLASCPGLDLTPKCWYEDDHAPAPPPIAGGLLGRLCGAVAPDQLAHFYHREAARRGVEFLFNTCVQRLSFEGRSDILLHDGSGRPFSFQEQIPGRLRISKVSFGDGRSILTDQVVVAAGAWSGSILHPLGVPTGCSPRRQVLFSVSGPAVEELLEWRPAIDAVDAPGGRPRMPFVILPTGGLLKPIFSERRIWVSCLDRIAHPIGTREDPGKTGHLEFSMGELGDHSAFSTDVLPSVTPYFPQFDGGAIHLENSWGGYYNFSPDGLPVILHEQFGVVFVGGDSGSGIMKADSLGRLVAAACQGRTEAKLFGGESYLVDRLSYARRAVEEERIIL